MNKDILIIEDSPSQAASYASMLHATGLYYVDIADTAKKAQMLIKKKKYDSILLDIHLPDANGLDLLKEFNHAYQDIPVIIITGETCVNIAVDAMRLGASDFVSKPVKKERLLISLENSLENKRLKKIENTFRDMSRVHFCDFIGASPEMQSVYHAIENAAHSDASVLITGESGTGKELAARAIHSLSSRQENPFIALNCGAIPETLMESEIFGHIKGAFTGATTDRDGAATLANHGSLFFDELAEMPLAMQVKLLRFIQTSSFTKVGDSKTMNIDTRFISATNKDLFSSVQNKTFREDLFYRLNVIPIHLPPLRKRGQDILLLANHFLQQSSQIENRDFKSFSIDAEEFLLSHRWPGNVRELENLIRRLVIMNSGSVITVDMFPSFDERTHTDEIKQTYSSHTPSNKEEIKPLAMFEREIIEHAIRLCNGNITQAAKKLDINPATIHRKRKIWDN